MRSSFNFVVLCRLLVGSVLLAATLTSTGQTKTPPMEDKPLCRWDPPAWGESAVMSCPLRFDQATQKLRLAALFLGSHDDTRISISASFAGKPVDCDGNGKTTSSGEDGAGGEVLLECRFAVSSRPGAYGEVVVQLNWHHAQPTGFDLTRYP